MHVSLIAAKIRWLQHCAVKNLSSKILNKADLADPESTTQWMEYLEQQDAVKAIACDNNKADDVNIIAICKQLVPNKVGTGRQIKAMIMGIPNVGKSTLYQYLGGTYGRQDW